MSKTDKQGKEDQGVYGHRGDQVSVLDKAVRAGLIKIAVSEQRLEKVRSLGV